MVTLYENTFLPEVVIESNLSTAPAYEITGIPFDTFGTGTLRIEVDLDVHGNGSFGSAVVTAYLASPGHSVDGAFVGTYISALSESISSLTYVHKVLKDGFAGPPYDDFTGPGVAQSVYIYPPVRGPDFFETHATVKNVHVKISGDAIVPDEPHKPLQSATGASGTIGAAATGHVFRYAPKAFGDQWNNPGEGS